MMIEKLNKENNAEGLMNKEQAAKYLNIKTSKIYQLTMRKKITFIKLEGLLRFRKSDLDEFIRRNVIDAEN